MTISEALGLCEQRRREEKRTTISARSTGAVSIWKGPPEPGPSEANESMPAPF